MKTVKTILFLSCALISGVMLQAGIKNEQPEPCELIEIKAQSQELRNSSNFFDFPKYPLKKGQQVLYKGKIYTVYYDQLLLGGSIKLASSEKFSSRRVGLIDRTQNTWFTCSVLELFNGLRYKGVENVLDGERTYSTLRPWFLR